MSNDDIILYGILGYLGYKYMKNKNGLNEFLDDKENGGEQKPKFASGGETLTGKSSFLPDTRQHPIVTAMPKKHEAIGDKQAFNYLAFPVIPGSGGHLSAQRGGDGYLEYGVSSSQYTT